MTTFINLLASIVLVFGLVISANASSELVQTDQFALSQSDTAAEAGSEEKKKEGEEEEPDC